MNLRPENPPLTPPRRGTGEGARVIDVPLLGGVRGGSAREKFCKSILSVTICEFLGSNGWQPIEPKNGCYLQQERTEETERQELYENGMSQH